VPRERPTGSFCRADYSPRAAAAVLRAAVRILSERASRAGASEAVRLTLLASELLDVLGDVEDVEGEVRHV
jgi:hypothetical protein